ncbi:MAG: hypothetical protein JWL83_1978 [Actinomycetia bacterium]|nr:hypothetical protein [Actinomycetes bacterium]
MRLLRTELSRFWARRATRWMFVLALAVIALGIGIAAVHSKVRTGHQVQFTCSTVVGQTTTPDNPLGGGNCIPTTSETGRIDQRYKLETELGKTISGSGIALLLLSVLLGATFIGGDYVGGALGGQLTFEPRRVYLYAIKALAVAIASAIVTAFLLVVLSLAAAVLAETRGVVGHLDASWYLHRAGDIARVSAACALIAALAFAVTVVARRTVAAVVAFLAFAFIVEPALTSAFHRLEGTTPVYGFIATVLNEVAHQGGDSGLPGFHSLGHAALVAGAWATAFLVIGGVTFARREIR